MSREKLSNQEMEVLDLTSEIKRLNREKSNLTIEINKLIESVSKIKEDLIENEKKAKEIISKADNESEKIRDEAAALYDKVREKEKILNDKIDLVNKEKEESISLNKQLQSSIKSNEGLKKSLEISIMEVQNKISKLNNLKAVIEDVLGKL